MMFKQEKSSYMNTQKKQILIFKMKFIIVITTVGNKKDAEELAEKIVSAKLGACVQISEIKSYYAWKGSLESSGEFKLMIKTMDKKYDLLKEFIIKNSKYDIPQI